MSINSNLLPHPQALGNRFWTELSQHLAENSDTSGMEPRVTAINVPLAGTSAAAVGLINTIGVTFSCRIVGYQIWALVGGSVVLDIQRSTPMSHAAASALPPPDVPPPGGIMPVRFPSLIGDGVDPPSINGLYAESLDTSLWAARDLATGDMLHFWAVSSDSLLRYGSMMLYLQDMDALVESTARRYTGA